MKPRIRRVSSGQFELDLPDAERDLIATLLPQMRDLLVSGDALLHRLFPPAYADDPERQAEYHALVHDELLEKRLAALDVVEETLVSTNLDEEQLSRWMGAVNDIRLVLGTRLDISEDMREVDSDDPEATLFALYDYLTWLLDEMVEALS